MTSMVKTVTEKPYNGGPFSSKEQQMLGRDFRCTLCRNVMLRVFQLTCGHLVCEDCKERIEARNLTYCPDTLVCQTVADLKHGKIFEDKFQTREVQNCVITCDFKKLGCPWQGQLEKYLEHHEQCVYNTGDPATKKKTLHFLQPQKQKLPSSSKLKSHKNSNCDEAFMTCPFVEVGCPAKQKLNCHDFEEHLKIGQELHLDLLVKDYVSLRSMTKEFGKLFDIKKRWVHLEENFSSISSDVLSLNDRLDATVHDFESKLTKIMNEVSTKQSVSPDRDIKMLKSKLSDLEAILSCLQQDSPPQTNSRVAYDERLKEIESNMKKQGEMSFKLLKQFDFLNARMDSLEQQINGEETTSFDGTLLWKITDFTKKRHDAITKNTTYILSQPFFSGPRGYKMCMRVYLNGDGQGKGTHISVFFTIMKSAYDAVLPWPFNQIVRIAILDQDGGQNAEDSFRPDLGSASFKRPQRSVNIATGCPLFLPLASLGSRAYVKDDCLFLKVVVEPFSL